MIPADVESELFELRNIIGLCAFAAEARRVLEEVSQAEQIRPELGATLSQLIPARRQWQEFGDHSGGVLNDVRKRLNVLLDDV